jgi:hypothetical protein
MVNLVHMVDSHYWSETVSNEGKIAYESDLAFIAQSQDKKALFDCCRTNDLDYRGCQA